MKDSEPKASMSIKDAELTKQVADVRVFKHCFKLKNQGMEIVFAAMDEMELQSWITALERAATRSPTVAPTKVCCGLFHDLLVYQTKRKC